FFAGDSINSDQTFGFFSVFSNTRTYNAQIRIYGNANTWNEYLGLKHDGLNGIVSTDSGGIILSPGSGKVGIGTSSPAGKLDVSGAFYTGGGSIVLRAQDGTNEGGQLRFDGAGTNRHFYFDNFTGSLRFISQDSSGESEKIRILNNGAVGIGTTAPGAYKLNVNGSMFVGNAITSPSSGTLLGNTDTGSGIILDHTGFGFISSSNWKYGILLDPDGGQGAEYFAVYDNLAKSQITDANAFVKFNPNGNSWINTGNLGIGTSNPPTGFKLAVNGKIKAKEIVVDTTGWADFVFAEDYPLTPLAEVEQYIKTNKHLPGIPSEREVAENGVSLGEMQAKLLQKIEELTLYVIELKKENELLHKRVSSLKKR
ncbi:MAG: hypothetical protein ACRENG_21960, partial [bacterium]